MRHVYYFLFDALCLCVGVLFIAYAVSFVATFRFSLTTDSGYMVVQPAPLTLPRDSVEATILLDLWLGILHPTTFFVSVDDCITGIMVNGKPLLSDLLPVCNENNVPLDLSGYVRRGDNVVQFSVTMLNQDPSNGFEFTLRKNDRLLLLLKMGMGFLVFCFGVLRFGKGWATRYPF